MSMSVMEAAGHQRGPAAHIMGTAYLPALDALVRQRLDELRGRAHGVVTVPEPPEAAAAPGVDVARRGEDGGVLPAAADLGRESELEGTSMSIAPWLCIEGDADGRT